MLWWYHCNRIMTDLITKYHKYICNIELSISHHLFSTVYLIHYIIIYTIIVTIVNRYFERYISIKFILKLKYKWTYNVFYKLLWNVLRMYVRVKSCKWILNWLTQRLRWNYAYTISLTMHDLFSDIMLNEIW